MILDESKLVTVLRRYFSEITAKSMCKRGISNACFSRENMQLKDRCRLLNEFKKSIDLYLEDPKERSECIGDLRLLLDIQTGDEDVCSGFENESKVTSWAPKPKPSQTQKASDPPFSYKPSPSQPARHQHNHISTIPSLNQTHVKSVTMDQLLSILTKYLSYINAKSVIKKSTTWAAVNLDNLQFGDAKRLIRELEAASAMCINNPNFKQAMSDDLAQLFNSSAFPAEAVPSAVIYVRSEIDIVTARRKGTEICQAIGFANTMRTKIATAISELTRNIVQYAGTGTITINPLLGTRTGIEIIATDAGPGIPNLDEIFSGNYVSSRGMGKGLIGTKNIMEFFHIDTSPTDGTTITTRKYVE